MKTSATQKTSSHAWQHGSKRTVLFLSEFFFVWTQ